LFSFELNFLICFCFALFCFVLVVFKIQALGSSAMSFPIVRTHWSLQKEDEHLHDGDDVNRVGSEI